MSVQKSRSNSVEESEVFHILGNDRRRAIVTLLAGNRGRADVSDIATEIAEREADRTSVPNNLYKSVYVSLQQTHLPQLEEEAVIEYDTDSKTIQPGANFEDVLCYVDNGDDVEDRVLEVHLGLCVLGLVLIALAGGGIPLISSVDPAVWSVVVLLGVAASSLYCLLG